MLEVFPETDFAGTLWLLDQAAELDSNVAIDGADFRVGEAGGIRNRPGSRRFTTAADAAQADSLFWSRAGTDCLLAGRGSQVRQVSAAGVLGALTGAVAGAVGPWSFAGFGAPGTERVYAAGGGDLVYWDGTAFQVGGAIYTVNGAGGAAGPRPRAVAVTPWDNRLLAVGFLGAADGPGAAASSPSTAFFSAQGDPVTWNSTWRQHFTPGDGEALVAAVVWRDRIFVFKQTKFFVVHGTSDLGGGVPALDYYPVSSGFGAHSVRGVTVARDGVYFVDRSGVYRTRGDEPELVSRALDPLFLGQEARYFTGGLLDRAQLAQVAIAAVGELVYVSYPTVAGDRRVLVYDPRTQWWGYDTFGANAMCGRPASGEDELLFAHSDLYVHRLSESLVDDQAGAVRGYRRGGWMSFGDPGAKVLRMSQYWGSGIVAVRYAADYRGLGVGRQLDMRGSVDTWGTGAGPDVWGVGTDPGDVWAEGPGFNDAWAREGVQGEVISAEVRAVESVWSVQRCEHHLLTPRSPAADVKAGAS